jgi:predicted 2-oxoglutarate/Fe(II)-dependent dioxygenase YbiX
MSIAQQKSLAVRCGERVPFTHGMTNDKAFFSFEDQAGRPAALILAGGLAPAATEPLVGALQHHAADFARHEADILLLVDAQCPHALDYVRDGRGGVRTIFCLPDTLERWGFDGSEPWLVVVDRTVRLVAAIERNDAAAMAAAALAAIAAVPAEAARDILLPAPVLLIPNVFGDGYCRALIDHFEESPHSVGGMASIDGHGNPIHKINEHKKRRRDCVLPPAHPLCARALEALLTNCVPELKRAFQFDARHTDRILIARYDDTGGYFRRHRDNVARSVAFRQFAISINLNSEEHEGGYLLFPEYNSHRYKPARGTAIIFSASLLHEVTPVLKGRRYVLLTFVHGAEAEARRLADLARAEPAFGSQPTGPAGGERTSPGW